MGKYKNLSGEKFGRLTVLKDIGVRNKMHIYLCRCDCGNVIEVPGAYLRSGNTQSCGCIHREQLVERNKTHGMAHTPIYNVWSAIKNRCYSEGDKQYKDYGGRGIKMCDKWLTFIGFYEDMGSTYKPGLTIERVDHDGNYCPENCIWADSLAQGNNTRRNRIETYNGVTDTLANLCRRFGFTYATIQHRLYRGWTVDEAFSTPRIRQYKKPYKNK